MTNKLENLLIISHVCHYVYENQFYAYAPYAREIDIWADLFPQILIAAPLRSCRPPGDTAPFMRSNIEILPQVETGGTHLLAKLQQLALLPKLVFSLIKSMWRADAIHVRCPGNLGLLGAILAPMFSCNLVAKYAGQWSGYPGEPITVRWQRKILSSRWWKGPVTVYGNWPDQPAHIVPFFTSVMTNTQMARARIAAQQKILSPCPHILYVGRLSSAKNIDILLLALYKLREQKIDFTCKIVGDGPQRHLLEDQSNNLGLNERVTFVGAVDFEQVLSFYEHADILVLASESEGWPKAIAEAMTFGVVCIGSDRGMVPWMLSEGRGIVIKPGNAEALANALQKIVTESDTYTDMSVQSAIWAQQYSLDTLSENLRNLLTQAWKVVLKDSN